MDKTYSETQGIPAFDWWKALENPPEECSAEHDALRGRARSWTMCACANQCAIIPRVKHGDMKGAPVDELLYVLGLDFSNDIEFFRWAAARETLRQIEARAAVLIAEELGKRQV